VTTTYFTACNTPYWPFVLPYAVSALHHDAKAVVEICVENPDRFQTVYAAGIDVIERHFPDRFLLRGAKFKDILPNSVRFVETPTLVSDYTYIGDIDILILDRNVTAAHVANMAKTGLPYSNCLRPGTQRLTGLHFTRTDAHYPLVIPPDANLREYDEELLLRLIVAKGLQAPNPESTFRPLHGIHFSIRRPPTQTPEKFPHWAITADAASSYLALWEAPSWQAASAYFHPAYRTLLMMLDAVLQERYPSKLVYRRNEAVALWSHLTKES
jgi:hypothetical protein